MLNRINPNEEKYEHVVLDDVIHALFTASRIYREMLPTCYYAYDIRHDDCSGIACQVQKHVLVNHWGTIVLKQDLEKHHKWDRKLHCMYLEDDIDYQDGLYYLTEIYKLSTKGEAHEI